MKSSLNTSVPWNSSWVRPLEHFVWHESFRLGQTYVTYFFCSPSGTDFGKMKKISIFKSGFFSLPGVAVHQLTPDHKPALAIRA